MFDRRICSDVIYSEENDFAPGRFLPCPRQDFRNFFHREFAKAGYAGHLDGGVLSDISSHFCVTETFLC